MIYLKEKDLNADGDFKDSFAFVDAKKGKEVYSPILKFAYIYVKDNYPQLNQDSAWKSFEELLTNKGFYLDFKKGKNALEETDIYWNCPQGF